MNELVNSGSVSAGNSITRDNHYLCDRIVLRGETDSSLYGMRLVYLCPAIIAENRFIQSDR